MPNIEKKQVLVEEIRDKVQRSKSMILLDARGLTVLQDTKLRKSLREAEIDYKVYKNTMINFAIKETASEALAPYLEGPTAVAFSYAEATNVASIINKQMKEMPNLEFKAGMVEGVVYDAAGMAAIADIPSKEVLLSRLLGSLKSPISAFARVLNALIEEKSGGGATGDAGAVVANEPTAEPVAAAASEPAAEPTSAVASEPAAEPTPAATSEPTAEPTEATASEPAAKPVDVVADEPTVASEPTAEPENDDKA